MSVSPYTAECDDRGRRFTGSRHRRGTHQPDRDSPRDRPQRQQLHRPHSSRAHSERGFPASRTGRKFLRLRATRPRQTPAVRGFRTTRSRPGRGASVCRTSRLRFWWSDAELCQLVSEIQQGGLPRRWLTERRARFRRGLAHRELVTGSAPERRHGAPALAGRCVLSGQPGQAAAGNSGTGRIRARESRNSIHWQSASGGAWRRSRHERGLQLTVGVALRANGVRLRGQVDADNRGALHHRRSELSLPALHGRKPQ